MLTSDAATNIVIFCRCAFNIIFLANSYFIFKISHAKSLKWGILGACTKILFKDIHKNSFSWIYQLEGYAHNLQFINGHFTTISGHFFAN